MSSYLKRSSGLLLCAALLAGSGAEAGELVLASRAQAGAPYGTPNGDSLIPLPPGPGVFASAVSADGRYTAFVSEASDLDVPGLSDVNGSGFDVFLYDRIDKTLTLVSHAASSASVTGNGAAATNARPVISADGRYVTFVSSATNLVTGQADLNATWDVFLYDRVSNAISLVSRAHDSPVKSGSAISHSPTISDDGRYVAYTSRAGDLVAGQTETSPYGINVFIYDRVTGTTQLASGAGGSSTVTGNFASSYPLISGDGSAVVFTSASTNLISGQVDNNNATDVFLYDRVSGNLRLVSHTAGSSFTAGSAESDAPSISADGKHVAFISLSPDLIPNPGGGDFGRWDVFHYEVASDATTLVSHAHDAPNVETGGVSFPTISSEGQFVVFESIEEVVEGITFGNNLFLWDRESNASSWIQEARLASPPVLSADAGFIAYAAYNAVYSDPVTERNNFPDVFLYGRASGKAQLLSRIRTTAYPTTANSSSYIPSLSADGSTVAFQSFASDLVPGDANQSWDVFVFHQEPGTPTGNFFTLPPCRTLDTRSEEGPLAGGSIYDLLVHGVCGVPATAKAIVANVTVTQASKAGYATLYPGDQPPPFASTLNFSAGQTRANNAILPLATDGSGALSARPLFGEPGGAVHLILDVSGYFE